MQPPRAQKTECRKYDPSLPWGVYHFIMTCVDCEKSNPDDREFIWKVEDQQYFQSRNFTSPPKRCKHHHRELKRTKELETETRATTAHLAG